MSIRRVLMALGAAALVAAVASPAVQAQTGGGSALAFSAPVELPKWAGGEPSIAADPSGNGAVYISAPQFIPAVTNNIPGSPGGPDGVGFWASTDHGRTFPLNANIGSAVGGGDSDVEVGNDHTVYVADLEAVATDICTSTDGGKSFVSGPSPCHTLPLNQQGPEDDREWLTRGTNGELYLTYHDFAGGFPLIFKSTDKAATFQPCGTILDPSGDAGQNYTPTGGTLVAKPVVSKDGTVYVEVTEPDKVSPPVGASLNHLFIASAKGCGPTTVFENHLIYTDPGASLGKIFNAVAVDGGGTLYVVAAGQTKAGQTDTNVWLFSSTDGGKTWGAPVSVNTPDLKANVMPAVVGGLGAGQVAVGWFGTTTAGDPNGLKNQWRYYAATSFDGGKTFTQATVTPNVIHYGDICTQGIFCGLVPGEPGNRNLADFSSITVDPSNGCLLIALPGDPENRPDQTDGPNDFSSQAFASYQTGGGCLAAAAAVGSVPPNVSGAAGANGGQLPATGTTAGLGALGAVALAAGLLTRRRHDRRRLTDRPG